MRRRPLISAVLVALAVSAALVSAQVGSVNPGVAIQPAFNGVLSGPLVGPGTVPASGDVRLQSGATNGLWIKNGTNTADIRVLAVDASSNILFGNNQATAILPGAGGLNVGSAGSAFGAGFFTALTTTTGAIAAATTVATGTSTVAALPACSAGAKGTRSFVTDATLNTFHSTAVGGGANNVAVVCDGTNWYID